MTENQPQISDQQKLSALNNLSNIPLLTIKTVFPFRFFPCVITLDREKLTIADYFFFSSKQVENLLAEDIVSVTSTENWLFANLTIVSGIRINKEISVSYLAKEDAKKLRRMVEGLLIASRQGIDLMKIPHNELVTKLEEIGTARV